MSGIQWRRAGRMHLHKHWSERGAQPRIRRLAAFLASAVLMLSGAILLSGCTALPEPDGPTAIAPTRAPASVEPTAAPLPTASADGAGNLNVAGVQEEYREAAKQLAADLPKGYVFPNDYPQGQSYDWAPENTGKIAALYYWRCAWTSQLIDDYSGGNQADIDRDIDTLDTWTDFALIGDAITPGEKSDWEANVIQPARDGHIGTLRRLGLSGCNQITKSTSEATDAPDF